MKKLTTFYKNMLESLNCHITKSNMIELNVGDGENVPIKVDGKNVYLPVSKVLESDVVGKVFFHPACETYVSKETEIFKDVIKPIMIFEIITYLQKCFHGLYEASKNKSNRTKLKNNVISMIEPFDGMTGAEMKSAQDLFGLMSPKKEKKIDKRPVYFNITKGGKTDDGNQIYYKTKCVFPYYLELARTLHRNETAKSTDKLEVFGHEFSKKVISIVVHAFEICLPGVLNPGRYDSESLTIHAGRLISLSTSYIKIAEDLNYIQNLFRKVFDKLGFYSINISWFEGIDDMDEMYNQIQPLPYNDTSGSLEQDEIVEDDLSMAKSMFNSEKQQSHSKEKKYEYHNGERYLISPPYESMGANERIIGHQVDIYNREVIFKTQGPEGFKEYRTTQSGNLVPCGITNVTNTQGSYVFNQPIAPQIPQMNMQQPFMGADGMQYINTPNGIVRFDIYMAQQQQQQQFQQMNNGYGMPNNGFGMMNNGFGMMNNGFQQRPNVTTGNNAIPMGSPIESLIG